MNAENATFFYRFGIEHIPKEIKKFIGNKNLITNIHRMQAYDKHLPFMLKGKISLDYTDLFSPNDYEKNDKIILKYF